MFSITHFSVIGDTVRSSFTIQDCLQKEKNEFSDVHLQVNMVPLFRQLSTGGVIGVHPETLMYFYSEYSCHSTPFT